MSQDNNWNIKIIDKGYKTTRDIYIFRRLFDGKVELLGSGVKEWGDVEDRPTLSLEPEQLQAFADALNGIGIKPEKGYIEGELEGTKRHLSDLRQLLKLK